MKATKEIRTDPAGSVRTPTLRQRRKAQTREELLQAALGTFSDLGLGAATVEEIAARAGVSKGTVYLHFPEGRDGLFRELYVGLTDELLLRALELHARAAGLAEQARALATALLELCSQPGIGSFFSISGPDLAQTLGPVTGRGSSTYQRLLSADIDDCRARGQMRSTASSTVLASFLVGAMRTATQLVDENPELLPELVAGVGDLASGLMSRPD